ncbi:hypothetical protein JMJ58_03720 [Haloterrigena salifodinae]|uniref:Uncharacterized protein n=1 Tax=Haloterrigena salifodinae TaxID=2675099 RepID=A0A8T8E352_9EURY|nr:hypothetical protein [Haloterrigena salifodinae]QRV16017.1 hypothetical protein JMJ58_03720 [Haloterrigena salifodinae]
MTTARYEMEHKTGKMWKDYGEDGYDYHATVAVRDEETGLQQAYYQRNIFDFGFSQTLKGIDTLYGVDEEDEWLDLHVTVDRTWEPDTDAIEQKGVLTDEEAMDHQEIEFVIWDKGQVTLEEGEEYVLHSVVTGEFDDSIYVSLNSATEVEHWDREMQEFDTAARAYLRENSPVPTHVRM